MSTDTARPVEIQILGLPVQTWAAAQEHVDGLLREFTLLVAGIDQGIDHHEPRQLLEVIAKVQWEYDGMSSEQEQQLTDAANAGQLSIDLTYVVPPSTAAACTELQEVLDAADHYCRQGTHLLSLATPPEALAFRRWYLGQFIAQINGEPPTAWPDRAAAGPPSADSSTG